MSLHIPAALRQRVWERASGLCEFCLLHEHDDWLSFQIDHLIGLSGPRIIPLSDTGEVTSRILAFNSAKRLFKRKEVAMAGRYPSLEALALLRD